MDVDAVYTWVNHQDAGWQELHRQATARRSVIQGEHESVNDPARFTSRDELYYSVRSLLKHAPWIRRIYILSNCQLPDWARSISNLVHVTHDDVFPDGSDLPTFNSHAIETVLHRIEGLSENFLYLNDDFFLCKSASPEDFFWNDGCVYYFPSKHNIPDGPASAQLRPVDNGAINASDRLKEDFGFKPEKKLHHAPYPLSRSLLQEIDGRYTDVIRSTRGHAFRNVGDIAMSTTLHAYYAQCVGRGRERTVAARYVDIGDPKFTLLVHPWSPLMRGEYDFLCLNEVTNRRHFGRIRDRIVMGVMKRLFE